MMMKNKYSEPSNFSHEAVYSKCVQNRADNLTYAHYRDHQLAINLEPYQYIIISLYVRTSIPAQSRMKNEHNTKHLHSHPGTPPSIAINDKCAQYKTTFTYTMTLDVYFLVCDNCRLDITLVIDWA